MTDVSAKRSEEDWQKALAEIEARHYYKDEAKKLYAEGKLKDGEIFIIEGGILKYPGGEKEYEAWCAGVFMGGKMAFVKYSANDARLPRLKRQGIAHLIDIVRTGWANTRQVPWLPSHFQKMADPDLELWGASSMDTDLDSSRFKEQKQVDEGLEKQIETESTQQEV